jgi:hypothetical protein
MSKSLSLQFPTVPVNSNQQKLIERYKDAYIQMKVNINKHQQDLLDSIYTNNLNKLKGQNIKENHIKSAREEADTIAHDKFIRIYLNVYKDLLIARYFYNKNKNETLLEMPESLHEFVYEKARHILGDKEIKEIRSIAEEIEANRIAKTFPSVPTFTPKASGGKKKKTRKRKKGKKEKRKKTRKGKKQKRKK